MGPVFSRCLRIRWTWRHSLILIAYLAILFRVIIPALEILGHKSVWTLLMPTFLLSFPVLALLVVIIERAGPLKNWSVSFLLFLFCPALVFNHDRIALLDYMGQGRPPMLWVTLLLNAMLFVYALAYGGRMTPRSCPGCQRRTLIPLMQLLKRDKRSSNTSWCASCGGKYWKDPDGTWRVERRKTWLDGQKEPVTLRGMKVSRRGRPEVSETTDRTLDRRAANEIHPS